MWWETLTLPQFLYLFPCTHILPIICNYWNNTKYAGDQTTQILLECKFKPPKKNSTPQNWYYISQSTRSIVFSKLVKPRNLQIIPPFHHYRNIIYKETTLPKSFKIVQTVIKIMIIYNITTTSSIHSPPTPLNLSSNQPE